MSVSPENIEKYLQNPSTEALGSLTQLAGISASPGAPDSAALDKQIAEERKTAETYEKRSVEASEQTAALAEKQATAAPQQTAAMDQLLQQYPTRDVAYASAMNNAPVLAIMTALGGKLTRLNGLEMLDATRGIMEGLNKSADERFQDSVAKWNAAFARQKELVAEQQRAQQLMLTAYSGRADAYQKASEASRRMTGDLLELRQDKIRNQIDLFKVQEAQIAQLERAKEAWARIDEQRRRDTAQERRWTALTHAVTDPRVKAQMQANQHEWANLNSQVNQLQRRRGQISNEIELTANEKAVALAQIDGQVQSLQAHMDDIVQRGETLANTMPTTSAPEGAAGGPPAVGGGPMAFKTADEVKQAMQSGQLPYLQAVKILKDQFGMQ